MDDIGPVQYFFCGGFGGICTVLVGHPFDTIKVRLQTSASNSKAGIFYANTTDCVKKTFADGGFRGFYKGMGAPLAGVAPIFAISFFGYRVGKQIFKPKDNSGYSYLQQFSAGAFSGVFTTVIMAPGERIKCLLQIQEGTKNTYNGPIDCIKQLYQKGGIRNLYRGTTATLLRDIPASGLYFLTYDKIRDHLTDRGRKNFSIFGTILAGGVAGMAFWLIGLPCDVLKSRLQTSPEGAYPGGIKDIFVHLLRNEGPLSLYKGLTPVLLRAFPANAACFLGFEACKSAFSMIWPFTTQTIT